MNQHYHLPCINKQEDLIIGATTMQKWGIKLDFVSETVVYDGKMHRLRI